MCHQHVIIKERKSFTTIGILKWRENGIWEQSPWHWIMWVDSGIVSVFKNYWKLMLMNIDNSGTGITNIKNFKI